MWRRLVTRSFQREATHQKRCGRFRSFRPAAGLMAINAAAAQSLINIAAWPTAELAIKPNLPIDVPLAHAAAPEKLL
jgi:hypothetical protein